MFFCIHDLNLYGIYKYILYLYSQNLKYKKNIIIIFINVLFYMIEVIISYLILYTMIIVNIVLYYHLIILLSYHLIILSILYIVRGVWREYIDIPYINK